MGALTNVQTAVRAARFGPHAPLRAPGTKSRRPDGLAANAVIGIRERARTEQPNA